MNLSVLMQYDKTIYMITYLVSLEMREISYLFNINIIKAEIYFCSNTLADNFLEVYCMLSGIRQIFKTPGNSISCTDIFTNLVDKFFFSSRKIFKDTGKRAQLVPFLLLLK